MENLVKLIRQKIDYYEFFSKFLKLKKVGSNYMALCPFHNDSQPSLSVSVEKGLWYCFGCNKGGDVFNFIMEMENCSFPESVEIIADLLSIDIKERQEIKKRKELKIVDYEIYKILAEFYHRVLVKSSIASKARDYLEKRKISQNIVEEYMLGYSSVNIENLKNFCIKKSINFQDLENYGIVFRKGNEWVEVLAGRLVIPIFSSNGKIIGFSGRIFNDDSNNKYINTVGLKKSETLYGINIAKDKIRLDSRIILVEGYFDVWALNSLGYKNTVGLMGTSISTKQIELIKRYSKEVILLMDSDKSGKNSVINLLISLVSNGLDVKVSMLTEYKDPHEYFIHNPERLIQLINNSKSSIDYIIDLYVNQTDAYKKQDFLEKVVFPFLSSIRKNIVKREYIKKFASQTMIGYSYILRNLNNFHKKDSKNDLEELIVEKKGLESYFLVFSLINFDLFKKYHNHLDVSLFEEKDIYLKLFKYLLECVKNGSEPNIFIVYELELNEVYSLATKISLQIDPDQKEEYFKTLIKNLERKYLFSYLRNSITKGDYEKIKQIQEKLKQF